MVQEGYHPAEGEDGGNEGGYEHGEHQGSEAEPSPGGQMIAVHKHFPRGRAREHGCRQNHREGYEQEEGLSHRSPLRWFRKSIATFSVYPAMSCQESSFVPKARRLAF